MAKDWAKWFYNSKEWKKCRDSYKQSKHGICERCDMPGEEVHHKVWLTTENINDPYITLSWDNLELLCMSCHSKEHMSKYSPLAEGYAFNENGEMVYTPPINK